jgi:hypothetical protein
MVVVWLFSNRVQRSYFRKYELCVETRERRGRDERRDVRDSDFAWRKMQDAVGGKAADAHRKSST